MAGPLEQVAGRYPWEQDTVTLPARNGEAVNAMDYGAKGDGVTDDTTALQNFITYCIVNGKYGYIPAGTYKVTATLNFSQRPGWRIEGAGFLVTTIMMATDNIPIFNLGSDSASLMHHFEISNMAFNYTNAQSGKTSATCIQFSQMPFEGKITDCEFSGGYYAMKVLPGIGCPWGMTFDNLTFGGNLYGGAMDWHSGTNGTPNNRFGRLYASCTNMGDANGVFNLRGYNTSIDTIEFTAANKGVPLFVTSSQSRWVIGTMKLENGIYNNGAGSGVTLFNFSAGTYAQIGYLYVGGNSISIQSGSVYIVGTPTAPSTGLVHVGWLDVSMPAAPTGSLYLTGATSPIIVDKYIATNYTSLTNVGGTTACDVTTVTAFVNGSTSYDKGDASYTVALGDPNRIMYQTPLTAARTVTLPSSQDVFTGLYYEVIVNGAAPTSTNTLTILSASRTLAIVTGDKVKLRFVWRRLSASDMTLGWTLVEKTSLL